MKKLNTQTMLLSGIKPAARTSRGITLVELIVAVAVSLILFLGIAQIFVSNKRAYRVQDDNSHVQENGRFALQLIEEDIRMAKYYGLNTMPSTIDTSDTDSLITTYGCGTAAWAANFSEPVFATNNTNPFSATCISGSSYTDATDILIVRRTDSEPVSTSAIKKKHLYLYTSLTDGASFRADENSKVNAINMSSAQDITIVTRGLKIKILGKNTKVPYGTPRAKFIAE